MERYAFFVRVAEDAMSSWLDLAPSPIGACIDVDAVLKQLAALGISQKCIDVSQIEHAFKYGLMTVVARGRLAVDGTPETTELFEHLPDRGEGGRTPQQNHNVRQHCRLPLVKKGAKLGHIHYGTKGEDGFNIYGHLLQAKQPSRQSVRFGTGVLVRDADIVAERDGLLLRDEHSISVENYLTVQSVDLSTGNIEFSGTVVIQGDIQDGFEVRSKESVIVEGAVGAASIIAGAKVVISGGVVGSMQKPARIFAEQMCEVDFVQNAIVKAKEGCRVQRDILHAEIYTLGRVVCEGAIIGGRISARDGIDCARAGSRTTGTHLRVNENYELLDAIESQHRLLNGFQDAARKFDGVLRDGYIPPQLLLQIRTQVSVLKLWLRKMEQLDIVIDELYMAANHRELVGSIRIREEMFEAVEMVSPGCYYKNLDIYTADHDWVPKISKASFV